MRVTAREAREAQLSSVAAGCLAGAAVAGTAAAEGGYFATSWGWTTLAFAWAAALALILRDRIRLSRLELLALGALSGVVVWTASSLLWTPSAEATMLELERTLVYVTGLAAALLVVRAGGYRALVTGVWAAATLVTVYSLLLRLFPGPEGLVPTVAGYRQHEPVGYWNGLGVLAAIGAVLAVAHAAHARRLLLSAAAGASLVPATLTLYFTFSRGAWIALAIGLALTLLLDPRRLHFSLALGATAPWSAVGVALASRERGLTHIDAAELAADAGRRLAPTLLLLALAAGAGAGALALLVRAWRPGPEADRRFAAGGALAVLFALGVVLVRFGGPVEIVRDSWRSFNSPPVRIEGTDLNQRLFTFSGGWRVELWRIGLDEFRARPLGGRGGGTYERAWLRERPIPSKVRNAHNLYVETLAETGAVGLALLGAALAAPLAAAVSARHRRLAPAAAGAYALFLVHAAVDWDWELPAVTLAALFCGAGLLAAARTREAPLLSQRARRVAFVAAVVLAGLAVVWLVGNRAIAESGRAIVLERWTDAERAATRATRWAPWSAQAWRRKGQAQVGLERYGAGERYLRKAIGKDEGDWELWYDLALATIGRTQRRALARAEELNPLSPEIAEFRRFVLEPRAAP